MYVIFLLPLIYIIVFKYYPMYGAQIAFKDYVPIKGIVHSDWVGLKYFHRFFHSYEFWRVLKNTLLLSLYHLLATFPIPILLAVSLNYVRRTYFRKTVQMVTYAPHFISVVVMCGIIIQFTSPRTGVVNKIIQIFGFDPLNLMAMPEMFKSIFVWSDVWQHTGFACIIYLAALAGIDPTLHEAAVMDGANKLSRIRNVDLPGIMPVTIILLLLNTGNVLDIGFEKVFLLQNPLNLRTSEIIDTYVYKKGLASTNPSFSYATAIGLFKSIISLSLLLIVNQAAKRLKQESLW